MANQTFLKGHMTYKEALANSGVGAQALKPGMLLQLNSDGTVQAHGTAGGNAQARFAMENELMGQGLSGSNYAGVPVGYSANDTVLFFVASKGSELQALVAVGAAAIVIGDLLESNGDGGLRKHTNQSVSEAGSGTDTIVSNPVVGVALQAVNNSSGSSQVPIKIEVM